MATGHGGGGSNGRGKAKSVAGSQRPAPPQWRCATAVAARHIPSSAEEGSFPAIFQFRDRNWLEQLLAESTGKEGTGFLPASGQLWVMHRSVATTNRIDSREHFEHLPEVYDWKRSAS